MAEKSDSCRCAAMEIDNPCYYWSSIQPVSNAVEDETREEPEILEHELSPSNKILPEHFRSVTASKEHKEGVWLFGAWLDMIVNKD